MELTVVIQGLVSLYWNFATQGLVIPDFAIYCGSLHWNFAIYRASFNRNLVL